MLKAAERASRRAAGSSACARPDTLMVADYRGLTMPEIDELRSRLLEAGRTLHGGRRTRSRKPRGGGRPASDERARADRRARPRSRFLEADGDPVAVAKVLSETARANDVLVIRGGMLEGAVVGDAGDQAARDAAAGRRPAGAARRRGRRRR